MSSLVVNSLSNANIYLNGVGLLGRAAEAKVPQPKRMMTDYKGLGMVGRVGIPTGFDKLEGSIKWSSFDPTTIVQLASIQKSALISMMADLQTLSSSGVISESPVIMNWTAIPKDIGDLDWKAQELVEFETMFEVYHVELSVAGVQLYLYDAFSNQYVVNGVDQLATYRANVGG